MTGVNDFVFEARRGAISGQRVTLYISVINNDQKVRNLALVKEGTMMVDDSGNQNSNLILNFGLDFNNGKNIIQSR